MWLWHNVMMGWMRYGGKTFQDMLVFHTIHATEGPPMVTLEQAEGETGEIVLRAAVRLSRPQSSRPIGEALYSRDPVLCLPFALVAVARAVQTASPDQPIRSFAAYRSLEAALDRRINLPDMPRMIAHAHELVGMTLALTQPGCTAQALGVLDQHIDDRPFAVCVGTMPNWDDITWTA